MKSALIAASWLVLGCGAQAQAQEPSRSIDLDLMAADPPSHLVVGRVDFTTTQAVCPHEFGTLRFRSDGVIFNLKVFGVLPQRGTSRTAPLDDQTYRHRIATDTCRVDIDIAEQVRRNEVWTSVLLPRMGRPSLSAEERSEAERQFWESHRDPVPFAQFGRYRDALKVGKTIGALRNGNMTEGLGFDGAQPCFDAVGDYLIDQRGVTFQFVTNLPGELNRFVLERVDTDVNHSRFYLMHGDCRFELRSALRYWHRISG